MKKVSYLKKALFMVTFVTFTQLFVSCNNKQKAEDVKDIAEEHNDAKFENNKQENDAQFLVNAAEINMEEIKLGQLAQQKSKTAHIKELGKMMEVEHTKSLNDLKDLAKSKMISIPIELTDKALDTYNEFNEKVGSDFDKAYADAMVNGHKDAIAMFEEASKDSNDTEIRNWAIATLPVLRAHLDHSMDCQKKL